MRRSDHHDRQRERGAVLALTALLLVALLSVAAIVVDLAALRLDRRDGARAADLGAVAGASTLLVNSATASVDSCNRAWTTVLANLPSATPVTATPACATFSPLCDDSTAARTVSGVAGDHQITIIHPVPASSPYMTGASGRAQPTSPGIDGNRCERMAVAVERSRRLVFGGIAGMRTGRTRFHAVARAPQATARQRPLALVLLDRTGCEALRVEGSASLVVQESEPHNGTTSAGSIVVDSDGSTCAGGTHTLDAFGTSGSRIRADPSASGQPGEIALRALPAAATTCSAPACEASDVSSGRVGPQPTPLAQRDGRTPIDHRYNCKLTYSLPAPWTGTVPACAGGVAAIDALVAAYQRAPGVAPAGFSTYPTDHPGGSCSLASSSPAVTLIGNWYVNCATLTTRVPFTVTGNAVFEGSVIVTSSSSSLTVGDGTTPRVAYLRTGSLIRDSQSGLILDATSVYLHNGGIEISGGGSGALTWRAPNTGDLAGLSLWSESGTAIHRLGGQAAMNVRGVFFTPNAGYGATPRPFHVAGGSGTEAITAQFFTYRLLVTGNSTINMKSPAFVGIPLPDLRPRLLR